MSKERILDQVETTRRRFLKRLVGGGAVLLAIPASAIVNAAPQEPGKDGKGDGKDGKGKKGKGKKGKGKGEGKGTN